MIVAESLREVYQPPGVNLSAIRGFHSQISGSLGREEQPTIAQDSPPSPRHVPRNAQRGEIGGTRRPDLMLEVVFCSSESLSVD